MDVRRRQLPSFDADEVEENDELDTTLGDVSEPDQDSESVDDDSESDDEEDVVRLSEPSKNAIYDKDGLLDKLNDIKWPENVEWIHTLAIEIDEEEDKEVDINDDLARESAIYSEALQGVRVGFVKLESRGRPYLRPCDYTAEMIKSDSHMEEVKRKLLEEKKELEEQEQRRKDRESKKVARQVEAEKQKEKKRVIESVKKGRKQRNGSGFGDDKDEMGLSFEKGVDQKGKEASPGDRSGGKSRKLVAEKGKKGIDKKKKKESKLGFGSRKGFNSSSNSGKKRRKLS